MESYKKFWANIISSKTSLPLARSFSTGEKRSSHASTTTRDVGLSLGVKVTMVASRAKGLATKVKNEQRRRDQIRRESVSMGTALTKGHTYDRHPSCRALKNLARCTRWA